ncbi:MAG: glutathione S-transferase family protein [Nannocystaceae bacterium]
MDEPIVLWQMTPIWGIPNPSPFCVKVETWLRMAELPYVAKSLRGPPKSRSGKLPYIERPNGEVMSDSTLIVETLGRERGVDLDAGLDADQRAQALLIQRLLEEELYWLMVHERWVDPANAPRVMADYFAGMPWIFRTMLVPVIRRQVVAAARGQGVARLPEGLRERKARADVDALAHVLGDHPFVFDRPSTVDATAYGFLAVALGSPLASPITDMIRGHQNLVDYHARMQATYWKDWAPT